MKKHHVFTLSAFLIVISFMSGCTPREAVVAEVIANPIHDLTIIHWNDFHSANLPYQPTYKNDQGIYVGGYANVAGYIDSLRGFYPGAVVLNAGDDFQGSPVSSMTGGISQILILNEIKPAAFTIGNHEFDYGMDGLKKAVATAKFDILSANLYDKSKNSLFVKPYNIVESNGLKIGIIGMILEDLESTVLPKNMGSLAVLDPAAEIQKYVTEIKDKTDIIIVLSHEGYEEDSLLATRLSEVDVIVGGHSHTFLKQPVEVNHILICQAGAKGERLGILKTKVNADENRIVSHNYEFLRTETGKVKPNQRVARLVDSLEAIIEKEMDVQLAELKSNWVRNSRGESNIGDWICDATRLEFNADIAYQNSGGIRKNQNAGPLLVRDIWEISPFDNTVVLIKVNGAQLKSLLQWRLDNPRDFLQTSGMKVEYDSKMKKVFSASVNGKPIENDKIYTIATNNYITGHVDRFFGLAPEDVEINDTGVIGRDVLLKAAKEQKVINSKLDGRLTDRAK